ncbi:MAG: autotransporter-associated beta strand repeat-containing protein [Planctomycetia bacterium]
MPKAAIQARSVWLVALVIGAIVAGQPPAAWAYDVSPPAILQYFEATQRTIERRTPDIFTAGYGAVWVPPPGRGDTGDQTVGYDVYDRFDLGRGGRPTLYGTETGIKTLARGLHRAGMDFHVDFILNHNGFADLGSAPDTEGDTFLASGGYPGFLLTHPDNIDGDFNSRYWGGVEYERLAGLIDIAHERNFQYIRSPVDPSDPRNLPAGTVDWWGKRANVPDPNNARFYPDVGHNTISVFDPKTGERDIPVHSFNLENPLAGDAVPENATGYLMRNAQWLVQVIGVDGLRIDAAKHVQGFTLDYFDRAVYRQNPRTLLDGSPKHVFSYSEVFDADPRVLMPHVKKDINPNDPGRIGGNRDTLDFRLYFALKENLESAGTPNAWFNIKNAAIDLVDDGKHNGSAGVKFVENHDVFRPYWLSDVAHAYMLMMPGNAVVYFNAREFGDGRDFPKQGNDAALTVGSDGVWGMGSATTRLVEIRNTHGRGNYAERWDGTDGLFAFERAGSAITLLSNRGDAGYDQRTLSNVGFAPGTFLVELTGNAADPTIDPWDDIPEVVTVGAGGTVNVRFQRPATTMRDGSRNNHRQGFLVYGLPTPQSANGLEISNVAGVLAGDATPTNNFENGTQRQSDVSVITADSFNLRLQTREVRLLGSDSLRDVWADGDNAVFKINGGLDINGNGRVDFTTPNSVVYGFETFGTKSSPFVGPQGLSGPRGDGEFLQTVDATRLDEGYHYITARAFRHRIDNGPPVFSEWKEVIYVDREKPVSSYDSNKPVTVGGFTQYENRDFFFRSDDLTANNMHVFRNLPAAMTDAEILAMVGSGSQAEAWDRDLFKKYFGGVENGNQVFTVVTYEVTGNYNIQRLPGVYTQSLNGRGLGDLNFNGRFDVNDVADVDGNFEQLVYARDTRFNPAADLNGDGLVNTADMLGLRGVLTAGGANPAVQAAVTGMLGRRADLSGDFGPTFFDIDLHRSRILNPTLSTDLWVDDIDADGVLGAGDFTGLVTGLFEKRFGDLDLDGSVGRNDLETLVGGYGGTGGWSAGNVTLDGDVSLGDLQVLLANYQGPAGVDLGARPNLDVAGVQSLRGAGMSATVGAVVAEVAAGARQSQGLHPRVSVAGSVTKTGGGTLVLDSANIHAGPTTVVAGTLEIADGGAVASSEVTVGGGATLAVAAGTTLRSPRVTLAGGTLSGGTVAVSPGTGIGTLAINSGSLAGGVSLVVGPGGLVDLPDAARVTVGVAGLALDEASSGGGRLDLGAGEVTIAAGGITAADLRADLRAGLGDGSWNGRSGITSSVASSSGGTRAVGYVADGSGGFRVSFAAPGDTNVDGVVDLLDLLEVMGSGAYGTLAAADWSRGDFNYDGVADLLDLLSMLGSGAYDQGNYFAATPVASSLALVPEPGTWLLMAVGLGGLAAVRCRALRRNPWGRLSVCQERRSSQAGQAGCKPAPRVGEALR